MKEGRLYYNADTQRYGLLSYGEWYIDGLHCGTPLEVWIDGKWQPTRVEHNGEYWYLVGFEELVLYDLKARADIY